MQEMEIQRSLELPASYGQKLTPVQAQKVEELKTSIDVHDKSKIIAFGLEEEKSIGKYYDTLIEGVGLKEIGEAGDIITKAVGDIKGFNDECNREENRVLSFFKKQKSKLANLQTKYKSASDNMKGIEAELQNHDARLLQISRDFESMGKQNRDTYEYLTMAIFAGSQILEEERRKLEIMRAEAEESGDQMALQDVSDYNDDILRFERRLSDLRESRALAIRQAVQISNIEKSADQVSETIRATMIHSMRIWKENMALALGMETIQRALNAVNAVKDATNAMLVANSKKNKELAIQAANSIERGIIEFDTIRTINQDLMDTLVETASIAQNAKIKREEEAKALQEDEAQLKKAISASITGSSTQMLSNH